MKYKSCAVLALCFVAACEQSADTDTSDTLAAINAKPEVTVSGLSSGGYMAGQFQLAYSAIVDGAAVVAAGPWGCSRGEISVALAECISGEGIDVAALQEQAGALAAEGSIDSLDNIAAQRLFFFLGGKDPVIQPTVLEAAQEFMLAWSNDEKIAALNNVAASHGWVTSTYGAGCADFGAPYINQCDFDLAGAILGHLYGDLNPPATSTSALTRFRQAEFGDASLAEFGYAYIPETCRGQSCRIHVFFHGCDQSAATIDTVLAENAGFNEWAETNNLIVLYPQVEPSTAAPMNPLGCWDWWGYTGSEFLGKDAAQLSAVRAMLQRLQQAE